jgi:hypothetical protein
MEVEIIKPMWFDGQPLSPGEDGQANPVVDMPVSDATYLQAIGRVRAIAAEIPPLVAEIPPVVAEGVADAAQAAVAPVADAAPDDSPVPDKSKKR